VILIYYLLVWVLPLVEHPIWGQKIGPLTGFEYIGIAALLYALIHLAMRSRLPQFLISIQAGLIFALYLIVVISAVTKGDGLGLNDAPLINYTSSFCLIFITISVIDTSRRLRWTVLALIGSYGFASLYLIREWQQYHNIYANFRPGWVVGDSNYFSTTAIFAIALAFYFIQAKRKLWEKAYCVVCLLLTIFAVTLGASRGGFLGLIVATACLVWRSKRRVRNILIMSALVVPLSLALPISPLRRFLDPSTDYGSTQFHLEAWKAGLHMVEAHPLVGVGLGNFKPLMPSYMSPGTNVDVDSVAHNMFVEVAAELGLPALVIFLAIFVVTYRNLGIVRRAKAIPIYTRETAGALQAGLLGFAVAGSFVSAEYQKTSWMGFALMFCLMPLARSQKLARQPEAPVAVLAIEETVLPS
jgi:O-antigen ligase